MCFMSLHSVSALQSSSASARTAKWFWSSIVNCRLISGHFSFETSSCLLRGSFDVTSLSFSLMFATSRWWSLLTSASRYTLTTCRDLRHLPLTAMWSIWFVVLPSGKFLVVLWMALCGNIRDFKIWGRGRLEVRDRQREPGSRTQRLWRENLVKVRCERRD